VSELPSLSTSIQRISELEPSFSSCFAEMIRRDGKIYTFDFFIAGVCDRVISTSRAFRHVIENRNYVVSAVILRSQIDTLFRVFGITLTQNPLKSCEEIFKGYRFDSLTDKDGKKLRDFHLKEKIGEIYPWIPKVYENSSGFVHMSEKNIFTSIEHLGDTGEIGLAIGYGGSHLPDELFTEVAAAFVHVSKICFDMAAELSLLRPHNTGELA
jgi:hypothetical protein